MHSRILQRRRRPLEGEAGGTDADGLAMKMIRQGAVTFDSLIE